MSAFYMYYKLNQPVLRFLLLHPRTGPVPPGNNRSTPSLILSRGPPRVQSVRRNDCYSGSRPFRFPNPSGSHSIAF